MATTEAQIQALSERIRQHEDRISTEEAAKTSVVLPFLQALGYDVFNPSEVIPEYTADAAGKKGEKVDYAIAIDGEFKILVECKGITVDLESRHLSQLYRYFSVTSAKFAILTNGRFFEFYSDIEEPNKLDKKPFFVFDIADPRPASLSELKKFERSSFDEEAILATAEKLKYVSSVKSFLMQQMENPDRDFCKVVADGFYEGRVTHQVREMISSAIRTAFKEIIRDNVQERLSSALESSTSVPDDESGDAREPGSDIETTPDEWEGFHIIRGISRSVIDGSRVSIRDAKSYCAVLVDDNNRKPLARMHFNRSKRYLGLFDKGKEERVPISSLNDIYDYEERLRETSRKYVEIPDSQKDA